MRLLQFRFTEPLDVPFEIMDDYLAWVERSIANFEDELSFRREILALHERVGALPESAFRVSNMLSMQQP